MYKIRYYYSSISKQAFLIVLMVYTMARLVVFHVGGFSVYYDPILSTIAYLLAEGILVFLFVSYKLYYGEFDDKTLTIYNRVLRKTKTIPLSEIQKAVFGKLSIALYTQDLDKPEVRIPVYFFGKISPVGTENLEIMLRNLRVPQVEKRYKALWGYGRVATFISYFFFFSCIPFVLSAIEMVALSILIMQAGGVNG